ncbi:hypothetical protein EXIGLDRAFT_732267, partial [Exidia glandulosa HHB12029]
FAPCWSNCTELFVLCAFCPRHQCAVVTGARTAVTLTPARSFSAFASDKSLLDRIAQLEKDRVTDGSRIGALENHRVTDGSKIAALEAKLLRVQGWVYELEPAALNVALTIALGTYTKAMILLLAAQRGDFYKVLKAFDTARVLDGQTTPVPHPPADGMAALLLAIARMKFLVPTNSTYVPGRLLALHETVGKVLLGSPFSSAVNLALVRTSPGGSVRRARNTHVHQMSMRRFAVIAQNEVLYAEESGQALSQDWSMLAKFFYHIHGFAIEEAVVSMTKSQLDDPLLVMFNRACSCYYISHCSSSL